MAIIGWIWMTLALCAALAGYNDPSLGVPPSAALALIVTAILACPNLWSRGSALFSGPIFSRGQRISGCLIAMLMVPVVYFL